MPDRRARNSTSLVSASRYAISAAHGEGVRELVEPALLADRCLSAERRRRLQASERSPIVGRPNVGKSTLVNALLGEERVIAFDQPGTTRDAIDIDVRA